MSIQFYYLLQFNFQSRTPKIFYFSSKWSDYINDAKAYSDLPNTILRSIKQVRNDIIFKENYKFASKIQNNLFIARMIKKNSSNFWKTQMNSFA